MVLQEFLPGMMSSPQHQQEVEEEEEGQTKTMPTPREQDTGPNTSKPNSGLNARTPTFLSGVSEWSRDSFLARMTDLAENDQSLEMDEKDECEDVRGENGRLSRSLKSWMPNYHIRSLPPQAYPPREPVFSARLGERMKIKRVDSSESVNTQLSLFSCSSFGKKPMVNPRRRRRRRKKEDEENPDGTGENSIWVKLASRRRGALDKMLQMHAMYAQLETETDIFLRLPEEEQEMVTKAGNRRGVILGPGRERSDSVSGMHKKLPVKKPVPRIQSAGGKSFGRPINFKELKRQMFNQRLAAAQQLHHKRRLSGRRSLGRTHSQKSLTSVASGDVFQHTPREMSPVDSKDGRLKLGFLDENDTEMGDKEEEKEEAQMSVWKGDSEILAIDLKRELTSKVKSKIESTTSALDRATGYGDNNAPRTYVGTLEEYPHLVDEDYGTVARIPQKVRISPHLSNVIRADIKVRMGRPRYHEIRIRDLELWNSGSCLDRSHRNLKVFNWLNSLRESEFDLSLPGDIDDKPPGGAVTTRDEVVVSVDDPKIKPLYERLKKELYIV